MSKSLVRTIACALLCAACAMAPAQEWPGSKPVTLLVGFPPGGTTDTVARMLAQWLARTTGGTFVVENRAGANGDIAALALKRAPADGTTLMLVADSIASNPAVRKTPYDPLKDFSPITIVSRNPMVLAAHPSVAANSVPALLEMMRNEPGTRFAYGSSGAGNPQNFAGERFKAMTGVTMPHVAYRGGGMALADLLAGQIPLAFLGVAPVMPYYTSGKLKVLAVTSKRRFRALPQVPTLAEAGLADFDMEQWVGVLGPVGMPAPLVTRINAVLRNAVSDAAVAQRLLDSGMEASASTPAEMEAQMRRDAAFYRDMAARYRISAD